MDHKQIEHFMNRTSNKPKLIVIYGPTGSGKTEMSIDIARYLDTEIISTDSRQIFKYMDIGTGKITKEEMQGVEHHMLDIVTPDQEYSVGQFHIEAQKIMNELYKVEKIPMLVGGTGQYINSIIYDMQLPPRPDSHEMRAEIELMSKEEVYEELQRVDPEVAAEIHPNNVRRVQRALEIYRTTGKSRNDFSQDKRLKYDVLFLTPQYGTREDLYNRINNRVQKMIDAGLIEEIEELFKKGYTHDDFGMNSIGYREFFPYLRGEGTLEQAISDVQQNSRNYAKRQLTWFRDYVNN